MAAESAIEWCDSSFNGWTKGRVEPRSRTSVAYWRQPLRWNARPFFECAACGWRGDANAAPGRHPITKDGWRMDTRVCPSCAGWKLKPARRRVFCASLADVFDNEVPISWLADLLSLVYSTPSLDWLLRTKRIGNWRARISAAVDTFEHRMANGYGDNHGYSMARNWLLGEHANIWLGATVVNQQEADRDIPKLLAVPAAKRFVSIEPMLGPIQLDDLDGGAVGEETIPRDQWSDVDDDDSPPALGINALRGEQWLRFGDWSKSIERLDWVICGGESGPHARPMHPDWVRSLRDQCAAAGVPFLFKQWGEWICAGDLRRLPGGGMPGFGIYDACRHDMATDTVRVGKRAAGRLLDGREHSEWPA